MARTHVRSPCQIFHRQIRVEVIENPQLETAAKTRQNRTVVPSGSATVLLQRSLLPVLNGGVQEEEVVGRVGYERFLADI